MSTNPAAAKVLTDLDDPDLQVGIERGDWRILNYDHPILDFAVTATEPNGAASEYHFRAELNNFPITAPLVRIWASDGSGPLAADKRPTGGPRVVKTFQVWSDDTVYRPWDRATGPHGSNAVNFPHLAWRPDRRLAFIFEDLHGILNSNARAHRVRSAA